MRHAGAIRAQIPAKPGIPFAIVGVAALIVVMLLTKPGTEPANAARTIGA